MSDAPAFEPRERGFYLEALLIDGQRIWYTDVVRGGVRLAGSDTVLLPERMLIGGLLANRDGSLLVAGADGIAWVRPDTGASGMLVEGLGGVNEMRADSNGGLYFGTIDLASIMAGKRPGPSALWHLATDRTLTQLKDGLTFTNGLSRSADGRTLFVNESFSAVRAYTCEGATPLGDPLWSLDKYDCDGMALDADGHIWITGFSSDHLLCLAPEDGRELRRVALPGPACTNIRFGGPDMQDMFVCMVDQAGAQALAEGRAIEAQNSVLFSAPSPVTGAAMQPADFSFAA